MIDPSALPTAEEQAAVRKALFEVGAVRISFDPMFTWTSGRKAPLYVDGRLLYAHPGPRRAAIAALSSVARRLRPVPEAIAGVATGGIPPGVLLADRLELPFLYVRPAPKDHGRGRQVEGELSPGTRVLIVEDIVSTGMSALAAAGALRAAGLQPTGVLALYSHRLPEAAALADAGLPLSAVLDFPALVEGLPEAGHPPSAVRALKAWHAALFS
ncbi:MAG: orotate phosphoribosyltransferase [Hydrogenibacillus schlegelii]|nr:orotate phosphoribosyltransferase [Hydrogenibacillus schlegelii]